MGRGVRANSNQQVAAAGVALRTAPAPQPQAAIGWTAAMKMPRELYSEVAGAVTPLDSEELRATYVAGDFPRSDKVQDLDKRYRWDLYWAAVSQSRTTDDAGISGRVSAADLDDANIDSALRAMVPPLQR